MLKIKALRQLFLRAQKFSTPCPINWGWATLANQGIINIELT
jgi:hypothetical protein